MNFPVSMSKNIFMFFFFKSHIRLRKTYLTQSVCLTLSFILKGILLHKILVDVLCLRYGNNYVNKFLNLCLCQIHLHREEMSQLFVERDRDFDGKLSFEEFSGQETKLERAFKALDKDGDGFITKVHELCGLSHWAGVLVQGILE